MPFLEQKQVQEMLANATRFAPCPDCGHINAVDYCRTCDEFYGIHAPDCSRYKHKHSGHRLTIVPFVEDRGASQLK